MIEDVAVEMPSRNNGLTASLRAMRVGQSLRTPHSYQYIYNTIKQAQATVRNPLAGRFAIVPDGVAGYRVGRVG